MRSVQAFLALSLAAAASFAGVDEEKDGIALALALRPGMIAADVGAGDGRFSVAMAEQVGPNGRVLATEVDPREIDKIRERLKGASVSNVEPILGDQDRTGLEAGCCDAMLLRLVYHHFTDPAAMRRSLWSALRPGARVAVIDVPPQQDWRKLDGVPERGGHGIDAKELIADMTGAGFELVSHQATWPAVDDAYCVVFRRPGETRP